MEFTLILMVFLIYIVGFAIIILILKWLGPWIFGIDKMIENQKEILEELKEIKEEIKK